MKCRCHLQERRAAWSHPARGAWIEIVTGYVKFSARTRRTPHGVRGLKFMHKTNHPHTVQSHPARGAWIEIQQYHMARERRRVAPRTGCVD